MDIFLLRHGKAEDIAAGRSDADRQLTKKGKEDILAVQVTSVNQRSPIYIGSAAEVTMAGQFLSQ